MNTLEMNNYLVNENDRLTKQVAKLKRQKRDMESINREMFQILQETKRDLASKEYTIKVLLGTDEI